MTESSILPSSITTASGPENMVSTDRPRRRHRPREETRALLLDAATNIAVARVSGDNPEAHNVLASIRIKDVLAEVNGDARSAGGANLTTGAFYQIWDDQHAFQRELLTYIMDQTATPGLGELETLAFELVSAGEPFEEILHVISDRAFLLSQESPALFLALGLEAIAPIEMIQSAQKEGNKRYLAALSKLIDNVLRYGNRRIRPHRTLEELTWATQALTTGYLLHSRTDPPATEIRDERGWTARATAHIGIVQAFTEEIPPKPEA